MIEALTLFLLCQLAGEVAIRALGIGVPGPVVGMALLLAILWTRREVPGAIASTADGILRNLSLMFVPAGVGITQQFDLVAQHGLEILLVLAVSTTVALAVTALVFQALARRFASDAGTERRP